MKVVKRLIIAGGGTAGWIAASWFSRRWGNRMEVVVIDKSEPERVGVGEATLLSFPKVMRDMGYQEKEWMNEIDATFKAGILFPGWGKEDNSIWHPFGYAILGDEDDPSIVRVPIWDAWSNYQDELEIKKISALYSTAMLNKIEPDEIGSSYAYQIDCGKLVQFLQKNTSELVKYIKSGIKSIVKVDDNIEKIILDDGSEVTGDLYFDCTGWKQLLMGSDNNIDLSDRLFIDSALAGRVTYVDKDKEMHPYTDCQAMEHGWRWRIPTQSRMGTGYCFNRSITSPDTVAKDFVKHWDNRISEDDLKLLDWKPQRCKQFWKGNVVSIGLSGGFIEPLESTGLALMIRGCEYLEESMYNCVYNPDTDIDIYNVRMISSFENAVDYVNMHYCYSERKGKFWDYVRLSHEKSGMQKYMEDQINDPTMNTDQSGRSGGFFGGANWHVWLAQLMPDGVPKKTYWYEQVKEVVPALNSYINRLDNNIKNSIPQKIILKEWYGN